MQRKNRFFLTLGSIFLFGMFCNMKASEPPNSPLFYNLCDFEKKIQDTKDPKKLLKDFEKQEKRERVRLGVHTVVSVVAIGSPLYPYFDEHLCRHNNYECKVKMFYLQTLALPICGIVGLTFSGGLGVYHLWTRGRRNKLKEQLREMIKDKKD